MNGETRPTHKAKILVVDDQPSSLNLLGDLLTEAGYEVQFAFNGSDALGLVVTHRPDLILLDVLMPGLDGYEVCRRLKADPDTRHIPVIFISGLQGTIDKIKAFELGGADFVTKPFQISEVEARVRTHLTLSQLQHKLEQQVEARTRDLTETNAKLAAEILERQETEAALRQTERRLAAVFQASPIAISLSSCPEPRYIDVNSAFLNLFGFKRQEVIGRTSRELNMWVDLDEWTDIVARLTQQGHLHDVEIRYRHKSGRLIYAISSAEIIDLDGEPHLLTMVRDISARKQAEAALRESETRYRTMYEHMAQGVFYQRADGVLIDANSAALEIFGLSRAEFLGRTSLSPQWRVIHEDGSDFPGEQNPSMVALTTGQAVPDITAGVYKSRREDFVWVSLTAIPQFRPGEDKPCQVFVTLHDLTERKKAEESLRRYERIVSATPDGVSLIDKNYVYQIVNQAYLTMSGKRREEIVGRTVIEYLGPQVFEDVVKSEFDRCLAGETINYRAWFEYPIAGRQFMSVTYFPFLEDDRTISGIVAVTQNLTDLKVTEQALRQHTERLEVLNEIGRDILAARTPAEIAEAALKRTRQLISCQRASVTLFDHQAQAGIILAVNGADETSQVQAGRPIPYAAAMEALQNLKPGQALVLDDLPAIVDPSHLAKDLAAEGIQTLLIVPLFVQHEFIGALNLSTGDHPVAFSDQDQAIACEVANQLAVALHHAHLFEEVQASQTRLAALSRQLIEAQEAERRRLARELHDELGQSLTLIRLQLQKIHQQFRIEPLTTHLTHCLSTVDQLLQQVRNLSLDLRPSMLDDLGLVATLRWYIDRQAQHSGFTSQFLVDPPAMKLPSQLETVCFRVTQEALTNISRHAQAQHVWIELRQMEEQLWLTIQDDGIGFQAKAMLEQAKQGTSMGLLGMQERLASVQGTLEIDSRPGQGTELQIYIPLSLEAG
ncbi:MAG TPA: PAS domain S-box protein [Anaerolineae bacterium]|nr:PAS domain S-box protein [Anaerolineae bacterium]